MNARLLEKFFNKQCTPEEVAEVLRWFNSEEEKPKTLSAIEANWQQFEDKGELIKQGPHEQLENIHHYLLNHDVPSHAIRTYTGKSSKPVLKGIGFGFRIAAIITLAIVASLSLHQVFPPTAKYDQIAYITKENPAGQKSTIYLEDGSKVILNAASALTYPEHFTATERNLVLKGEAFFEVTKDARRPFTVVANGIATTALGTSFNINAFEEENNVSIALASGKVKVVGRNENNEYHELNPGECITYHKQENNFEKGTFEPHELLSWKEGIIYFHDADFQQITNKLSKWYGVNFTVENLPGQSWKYTGEFNNENLENVLMSISYAKKFDFAINDNTVKIVFH